MCVAGEGALGGDGVVAVLGDQNNLPWIAFFDWSNPFVSLRVEDRALEATSNLGHVWRFTLPIPQEIVVTSQ
jgi:hypothetical protein